MTTDPSRSVPPGSTIRFGPANLQPSAALLDAIRDAVAGEPTLRACTLASIEVLGPDADEHDTSPPAAATEGTRAGEVSDLLGLHVERGGAGAGTELIERIGERLAPHLPADASLSVTVLSDQAQRTMLRIGAPIGAGGALEQAAARTLQDPSHASTLVDVLLATTLLVPALGAEDEPGEDGHGDEPDGAPRSPRPVAAGEQVRYPLVTIGGRETIAAFTSREAVEHAAPAGGLLLAIDATALFGNWPLEMAFALDLGTRHALQLAPEEAARLRAAVR